MSVHSTGSPDPDDPRPTPDEPASPVLAHATASTASTDRSVGSPAPPSAAPHEGLVGQPDHPLGDDPRPGNVGRSAEAPQADDHQDALDEAADETFPASDPPSWAAAPTTSEQRPEPHGTPAQHGLGRVVDEG